MKQDAITKTLSRLPLFAKTPSAVLEAWLQDNAVPTVTYAAGEDVTSENARYLGVLLHGTVLIQSADSGKSVLLRRLNAPAVFGAASLFCPDAPAFSQIRAKSSCSILRIEQSAVRALMSLDEGFRDAYLTLLAERVRFLNQKIRAFTAGSADRRVALWLISEESDVITLPASLSSLADMLDIGRASLYRALDKLEQEALIRRQGRTITLLSPSEIYQKYNA